MFRPIRRWPPTEPRYRHRTLFAVSESRDKAADDGQATTSASSDSGQGSNRNKGRNDGPDDSSRRAPEPRRESAFRLSRRGWTVLLSGVLVVVFGLIGAFVRVPYVALGPGPTYDTLGGSADGPVVRVEGHETFPTAGELRMTTVSLTDDMTLFGALGMWASGRFALAPREDYFKPGATDEQVKQENVQQFQDSQSNAQVAALRKLGFPVKVLAKEVVSGSPADSVLAAGDRLLVVNGKKIENDQDVIAAMEGTKPGETISLTFQHEGQPERTESVTLAQRADGRPEGFIGLQAIDRSDVPFNIEITLEDVGGPSAGLMFALALYDRMTPGELAGGAHIAGTGEINERGEVGAIGGISFKVVAAREAGATAFLVPEANCAEAAAAAPEGLRLLKVGNLDAAISALENVGGAPTC